MAILYLPIAIFDQINSGLMDLSLGVVASLLAGRFYFRLILLIGYR